MFVLVSVSLLCFLSIRAVSMYLGLCCLCDCLLYMLCFLHVLFAFIYIFTCTVISIKSWFVKCNKFPNATVHLIFFVKRSLAITFLFFVISSWNLHDVCQRFICNQKRNFSWIRPKAYGTLKWYIWVHIYHFNVPYAFGYDKRHGISP